MGFLRALAALPLAPVKGLVGLARYIQQQAEQERAEELMRLQAELLELQLTGDLGQEEFAKREADLVEKVGLLVGTEADGMK